MQNLRIIPRLDIKGPNLIKGVHLEGLRVVGEPNHYAMKYYKDGADELIYIDSVASLYNRNNLKNILEKTAENIFIPITVGGGIRSLNDASELLKSGADKVAINTAAIKKPTLISEVAERFGAQCMVLSVEAKLNTNGHWEALTDNGRERTGLNLIDWVIKAEELGAGEILLTSVDREGTKKGYDLKLIKSVSESVKIPIIVSGGMNSPKNIKDVYNNTNVEAYAMANVIHYGDFTIRDIKHSLKKNNIPVRFS